MNKKTEIRLCLGSSCFPRGNDNNLEIIRNYIEENRIMERVDFRGHLCVDKCKTGPNVSIDGKTYSELTSESLIEILDSYFKK
jgi:NADH:ubiquinone oxidoreductase subunit E